MTNAQEVFNLTMSLMDELSDAGLTDTADTAEYKNRTLALLNVLQSELYMYSDTYTGPVNGKRAISIPIINFTESIQSLDDYICRGVLPYGLAALLLMDENPSMANFFQQKYEELRSTLSRGLSSGSEEIEDVYGGFPHCEYSHW